MTDHWLFLLKLAPGKVIWVPKSCKCFFLKSEIGHIFACIIRNPGLWSTESKAQGIRKIPPTIGIQNPSSMRIQYQYLESEIYSVESRIPTKLSKLSWITLHVVTNQKVSSILLIDSKRVRYNWNSCINCFMRYVVKNLRFIICLITVLSLISKEAGPVAGMWRFIEYLDLY